MISLYTLLEWFCNELGYAEVQATLDTVIRHIKKDMENEKK